MLFIHIVSKWKFYQGIEKNEEDLKDKLDAVKRAIKRAKRAGDKVKAKQLKREYEDLKVQQKIKDLDVDIKEDVQERSLENDEEQLDLTNFWHYKVMHSDFVGDNAINLTNDNSDPIMEFVHLNLLSYKRMSNIKST